MAISGTLGSAFLVTYMLSAPALGWLADRFSRWIIIGLAVIVWSLASGATPAVRFLTLDLQVADAYEAGKKLDAQANPASVPDLGDDAYYANFSGISIASLNVKKGDVSFKITWYGAADSQTMMTAEKTLASQVLSNL